MLFLNFYGQLIELKFLITMVIPTCKPMCHAPSRYLTHILELNIDWLRFSQSVNVYMVSKHTITRTIFLILKHAEILAKHKVLKHMLSAGTRQHRQRFNLTLQKTAWICTGENYKGFIISMHHLKWQGQNQQQQKYFFAHRQKGKI